MKRVLFVWGGWDGHEPKACVEIMAAEMKKEDFGVEIFDTLDVFKDEGKLKTFSLIAPCWTMGKITPEQSDGLRKAVLSGVGLAGWHGGAGDSFREDTEYQFMVGGQWWLIPAAAESIPFRSPNPMIQL